MYGRLVGRQATIRCWIRVVGHAMPTVPVEFYNCYLFSIMSVYKLYRKYEPMAYGSARRCRRSYR